MYVRNLLHAGDFLEVVPVGLPLTLQYDENGVIEKVFKGFKPNEYNISDTILDIIKVNHTVPLRVPLKDGTTWIKGTLYTATQFEDEGKLSEAISSSILKHYLQHPDQFNFFAGGMESLSCVFRGAQPIRQWLQMTGFNILPGWLITANPTKEQFVKMLSVNKCTFRLPMISDYIIYRNGEVIYTSTDLSQYICKSISTFIDSHGNIKVSLDLGLDEPVIVHYSDVVTHNIQPGRLVVLDVYGEILCTYQGNSRSKHVVEDTITCPVCKKIIPVSKSGVCKCNDTHCMSRQYDRIVHFLKCLSLPVFTYDEYKQYIKDDALICFTDVMILPQYDGMKIQTTLSKFLSAVVPDPVVQDNNVFTVLCNLCNNSKESLLYYINHPDKIISDLGLSGTEYRELVHWLYDLQNVSDVVTLLESDQVEIVSTDQKFEGAPIFRGKRIMLTGKFNHGDYNEIYSILQSYAAEVVTKFDNSVDCVLVGDIAENVNGSVIKSAKSSGITIMEENNFFISYGIDEDLQLNLE